MRKADYGVVVLAAALVAAGSLALFQPGQRSGADGVESVAEAYRTHQSNVRVTGVGTVVQILPDDTRGSRHQRFILKLPSGQTLLIAHNIDIAPPLPGLSVGDTVAFRGEYEWNPEGGVVHWTHHDPDGGHVTGWLKYDGRVYK